MNKKKKETSRKQNTKLILLHDKRWTKKRVSGEGENVAVVVEVVVVQVVVAVVSCNDFLVPTFFSNSRALDCSVSIGSPIRPMPDDDMPLSCAKASWKGREEKLEKCISSRHGSPWWGTTKKVGWCAGCQQLCGSLNFPILCQVSYQLLATVTSKVVNEKS